ncbi:hypothetical protein AMJ49_04620 [Parcubacteria bacterium DG_74_2]|nr:MAG: hypothetical protein AMJ49_04620 [Parcubacteria bacterium DG_74_2]
MNFSKLLRKNIKPSPGCTEVVSIGLASSLAYHAITGYIPSWLSSKRKRSTSSLNFSKISKIIIEVDRNVYKNSFAVGIPGGDGYGIELAAALGTQCNPECKSGEELKIFQRMENKGKEIAKSIINKRKIAIKVVDTWTGVSDISITVRVKSGKKYGIAKIKHYHDNVTFLRNNKEKLYEKAKNLSKEQDSDIEKLSTMTIEEMIKGVEKLSKDDKKFLLESIEKNKKAHQVGIKKRLGLGIGITLKELINDGVLADDVTNNAKVKAGAAVDARMSGYNIPIMICAGSGNQGIVVSNSLLAVHEKYKKGEDKLAKAFALSHLVTLYASKHIGWLSALCGAPTKAGIGATAGITYYLGGISEEINRAINHTAANSTGIICDGAKVGCAEKIITSVEVAIQSALFALRGLDVPKNNGIIAERAEDTIKNIGLVSKGMIPTDKTIVEIIKSKK